MCMYVFTPVSNLLERWRVVYDPHRLHRALTVCMLQSTLLYFPEIKRNYIDLIARMRWQVCTVAVCKFVVNQIFSQQGS